MFYFLFQKGNYRILKREFITKVGTRKEGDSIEGKIGIENKIEMVEAK